MELARIQQEVYEQIRIQGMTWEAVREKYSLGKSTISHYLRTFESENPQLAEDMKKKAKLKIIPEDYKKLLEENARLRGELKQAKLRADLRTFMRRWWLLARRLTAST